MIEIAVWMFRFTAFFVHFFLLRDFWWTRFRREATPQLAVDSFSLSSRLLRLTTKFSDRFSSPFCRLHASFPAFIASASEFIESLARLIDSVRDSRSAGLDLQQ